MTIPAIIVHRAGGFHAPENTIEAMTIGLSFPVDGIEIDVVFTKDHIPIVFHDDSLGRLAGRRWKVRKTTYDKISSLDVGSRFDPSFAGVRIPTLEAFLQSFDPAKLLYLEIKRDDENLKRIVQLLEQYDIVNQTTILSFSQTVLCRIKEYNSRLRTMFLMGARWRKPLEYSLHPMIDSYGVSYRLADRKPKVIDELLSRGFYVNIWSCNDMAIAKKLVAQGVHSITTDLPQQMIQTIKSSLPR